MEVGQVYMGYALNAFTAMYSHNTSLILCNHIDTNTAYSETSLRLLHVDTLGAAENVLIGEVFTFQGVVYP